MESERSTKRAEAHGVGTETMKTATEVGGLCRERIGGGGRRESEILEVETGDVKRDQ